MTRSLFIAALAVSSLVSIALPALAEETTSAVSVVRSQFTDKIDNRLPQGDASALAQGKPATYWAELNNPGEATEVTLVWKLDGREAARQSLEVGRSAHWRTWGICSTQKAHSIEVEVLDKEGHTLKTDSASL
jgi:hypothetical protein